MRMKMALALVGLIIVIAAIKSGINPDKWELYNAEYDPKEPTQAVISAELKPFQQEATVNVQFFYKQGVNWIPSTTGVIQLDKDKRQDTMTLTLPGSSDHWKWKIAGKTLNYKDQIKSFGTGSGEGELSLKGDVALDYRADFSGSVLQGGPNGQVTFTYNEIIQRQATNMHTSR